MPTLRESQNFFFNLMARPEVIGQLKKDREKTLKRFFRSERDREALRRVPLERLETYRKHVSVGLLGGIEDAFPVLRSLVSLEEWNGLLNDFYLKRLTRSPIARRVFREFSLYLQKKYRGPLRKRMPYLSELADYENLDLRLLYEADLPVPEGLVAGEGLAAAAAKDPEGFLRWRPVLNPHRALNVYRWPVHRIRRGYSSAGHVRPGSHPLLVYRDPESLKIRFLEASPSVAELVRLMSSGQKTVGSLLESLLKKRRPADPVAFVREAVAAIASLKDKGVVLGFRKTEEKI